MAVTLAQGVEQYSNWHFANIPFVRGPITFALSALETTGAPVNKCVNVCLRAYVCYCQL